MNNFQLSVRKNAFILWNILTSFSTSAYYVLWIKGLQIVCWPIDFFIALIERAFVRKAEPSKYPIIFVVGIHRTGSTFVSQVLADGLGFAPLGNYASIFPRSKYFIHSFLKRFYSPRAPGKPHKFKSFYGISRGFFSIGDCYEVWDRWFGKDHYNRPGDISEMKKESMADYFSSLQNAWGIPVITKNNRNTLILKPIHDILPNVFFVLVNRSPAAVIQSTMRASKDFFGTDEIIWGLRNDVSFNPENYKDKLDAYCHQYLDLEDSIRKSINQLPSEDYLVVQYENFCEDPEQVQKDLIVKLKAKYDLPKGTGSLEASKYATSQRLKDGALTEEINRRIREIRTKQTANPSVNG